MEGRKGRRKEGKRESKKEKKIYAVTGTKSRPDLFLFSGGSWGWNEGWGAGGAFLPRMLGERFPQAGDGISQCLLAGDDGLLCRDF